MDPEAIRRRSTKIAEATKPNGSLTHGYWVGDAAGKRMALDDFNAGRQAWLGAHRSAVGSLAALQREENELAEMLMLQANDLFIDALWSRIEPADIEFLANGAGRRGRPSETAIRDADLSVAVAEQERLGFKGKGARNAALAANPSLERAFAGVSDDTMRKAISRARRPKN